MILDHKISPQIVIPQQSGSWIPEMCRLWAGATRGARCPSLLWLKSFGDESLIALQVHARSLTVQGCMEGVERHTWKFLPCVGVFLHTYYASCSPETEGE